jgi:hypothetical protein
MPKCPTLPTRVRFDPNRVILVSGFGPKEKTNETAQLRRTSSGGMHELNEQHVTAAEDRARKAMEEVRRLQLEASTTNIEV